MVELYGGAVTTTLPKGIVDVSELRQVPDTQEVFILEDGEKDISIIFDLLEQVPTKDTIEALKIHIDDALETNLFTIIEEVLLKNLESKITTCYVKTDNLISVLSLIRLNKVETDVVITMNVADTDIDLVMGKYYEMFKNAGEDYKIENWDLFG